MCACLGSGDHQWTYLVITRLFSSIVDSIADMDQYLLAWLHQHILVVAINKMPCSIHPRTSNRAI